MTTVCEAASMTVLLALLVNACYTDVRHGIVSNKTLLYSIVSGLVINTLYTFVTQGVFLAAYLGNIVLLSILSLVLYAYQLWAAGDSKMLIAVACCLPGRVFTFWGIGQFAGFSIVVIAFITAFIYVLAESVALEIRNKDSLHVPVTFDIQRYVYSYFFTVAATTILAVVLSYAIPWLFRGQAFLLMAADFVIILSLMQIRNRLRLNVLKVCTVILWTAVMALYFTGVVSLSFAANFVTWSIALLVAIGCALAGKYGYQTIPTSTVRAGMILSASTVALFSMSRIKGLPCNMSEDLGCRMSVDEATSVRRWENSAHGKPYVTIVRKLPFALFIGLGTISFIIIEVISIWR